MRPGGGPKPDARQTRLHWLGQSCIGSVERVFVCVPIFEVQGGAMTVKCLPQKILLAPKLLCCRDYCKTEHFTRLCNENNIWHLHSVFSVQSAPSVMKSRGFANFTHIPQGLK